MRTTSRNTIYYILSIGLNKAIPLITLPFLSNSLTSGEFGQYSLFQALYSILTTIILFNTGSYVTDCYFKGGETAMKTANTSSLLLNITISLFLLLVVLLFPSSSEKITGLQNKYIISAILLSILASVYERIKIILRNKHEAIRFTINEGLRSLVEVSIIFILVGSFHFTWSAKLYSIFLGLILPILIYSEYIVNLKSLNIKNLLNALKYTSPLLLHSLSSVLLNSYDRFAINSNFDSPIFLSTYSAWYQIGSIILFLGIAFNRAYVPTIYKNAAEKKYEGTLISSKLITAYIILAIFLTLLEIPLGLFLLPIEYKFGWYIIIFTNLAYTFYGLYMLIFPTIITLGNRLIISSLTLIAFTVNALTNYLFLKNYGIIAAGASTLVSYSLLFFLALVYQKRLTNSKNGK